MEIHVDNTSVVQLIQLSLVPVFLLVAIGQMLNVVTGRLARVIDRARYYEEQRFLGTIVEFNQRQCKELNALRRRMRFANWAINFLTGAAIFVCLTVILLLLNGIVTVPLDSIILFLYMFTMSSIFGGLICFFIEVGIASATLRIPETNFCD
ncbi:DUF2721 domain-containing protein [Agaribacter flavus]|uniref:DUF2721 domain-containing protein n=1 Tax=Agaribacter flavus TaxID=1902781 RepID=A0ABV7FMX0_9ALTE